MFGTDAITSVGLDIEVERLHGLLLMASSATDSGEVITHSSDETSVDAPPLGSVIEQEFKQVIPSGASERFERGFESAWDDVVAEMLRRYGSPWLSVFESYQLSGRVPPHLAAATLEALGQVDDGPTRTARRRLFERELRARLPEVRDAAAQALATLGDPAAAVLLSRAAVSEPMPLLRGYFVKVARDLEQRAPEIP